LLLRLIDIFHKIIIEKNDNVVLNENEITRNE